MAPYQYSPLKESLKEIRVLTLHPGDFSADIHVSIDKVLLSPESPPTYEALTWGSHLLRYLDLVANICQRRSFITTEEGYIGIAPKASKPGDKVCVLLGCLKPLVLRPIPGHQYQVVGECYVQGLGNVNAFLGPLPENYQSVHIYDQESELYSSAFIDKETGNTQYRDPRMGEGAQMVKASVQNLDGLVVTSEMLKRRGVQVQKFHLI